AGLDDAAIGQHVDHVRLDVVEQALVEGDHQERAAVAAQRVDAIGHGLKRVDVQARVSLVQDRQLRLEYGQLEDLVALLLAAGKTFVHAAVQELVLQVQHGRLLAHQLEELHRVQLLLAAHLALGVERAAQEVGVVHARDLDRVLEGQEQAGGGALLRLQLQQGLAVELDRAGGDLVAVAAGEDVAKGRLAGAVGAHDGVHLARLDLQREALEDFLAGDAGVEVFDLEHGIGDSGLGEGSGRRRRPQPTLPSSETSSSFLASTANSIGSSRKTCLQKPSTISETASSSEMP